MDIFIRTWIGWANRVHENRVVVVKRTIMMVAAAVVVVAVDMRFGWFGIAQSIWYKISGWVLAVVFEPEQLKWSSCGKLLDYLDIGRNDVFVELLLSLLFFCRTAAQNWKGQTHLVDIRLRCKMEERPGKRSKTLREKRNWMNALYWNKRLSPFFRSLNMNSHNTTVHRVYFNFKILISSPRTCTKMLQPNLESKQKDETNERTIQMIKMNRYYCSCIKWQVKMALDNCGRCSRARAREQDSILCGVFLVSREVEMDGIRK